MKRIDLSLILPCYNEEPVFAGSVASIIRVLSRSSLTWEIIFVDDGSRDRTRTLIADILRRDKRCRAIYHAANTGRGRTVTDGIHAARGRVAGYMDIDCEVSPVYLPDMAGRILDGQADMLIGRRIYRSSVTSMVREIMSVGYRALVSRLLPTAGLDTESGYKLFDRAGILPVLEKTTDPHWFWDTEIVVFSRLAGLTVSEYPVLFIRRTDKQSSVRIIRDTVTYLARVWRLSRQLHRYPGGASARTRTAPAHRSVRQAAHRGQSRISP